MKTIGRLIGIVLSLGVGANAFAAVPALERPATLHLAKAEPVFWHHGWYGGRFGWWWVYGGAWYPYFAWTYPYPPPYAYPYGAPSTVVVQNQPQAMGPPPAQSWYYCANPRGYYPYVAECSVGWQAVPATPPNVTNSAPPAPPSGH